MVALTAPVTTLVDELPNNVAPAWSPDGQQIVFLSNRSADNSAGAWRLWVMKADGNNQQPLPINVTINYTYGNEQLVSWGQ
jgi:Tol biopolymer transport system component